MLCCRRTTTTTAMNTPIPISEWNSFALLRWSLFRLYWFRFDASAAASVRNVSVKLVFHFRLRFPKKKLCSKITNGARSRLCNHYSRLIWWVQNNKEQIIHYFYSLWIKYENAHNCVATAPLRTQPFVIHFPLSMVTVTVSLCWMRTSNRRLSDEFPRSLHDKSIFFLLL